MIIKTRKKKIKSSEEVFEVFKKIYDFSSEEDKHKEKTYVMGLNSRNIILFIDLIALGTINQVVASIREAMRQAIIKNAVSVIACHNHPSGESAPSSGDRNFTRKLKEAGDILEVKLLDHIIIAKNNYFSFADKGII